MKHQLIIFYGACSGIGKSTLAAAFVEWLRKRGENIDWLHEEYVLDDPTFAEVVTAVNKQNHAELPALCLAATETLIAKTVTNQTILITDSILPYFDWLFAANIPFTTIEQFSQKLFEILQPLNPLIVYLTGDIATAYQRAGDSRRQDWLAENIAFMHSWATNRHHKQFTFDHAVAYREKTNQLNLQLLQHKTAKCLVLNTVADSFEQCQKRLHNTVRS